MMEEPVSIEQESHLRDLRLNPEYRSDADDLVGDFYTPCLERSVLYRRAVGYFTSCGLAVAAQGVDRLIRSDGRMLLVASPVLDAEDIEAIKRGYRGRADVVERSLLRAVVDTPDV